MPKKKKKMNITKMYIPKSRKIFCVINKDKQTAEYTLSQKKDCYQKKYLKKFKMTGFNKLPAGFFRNGKGLINPGYLVLDELVKKFGNINLTIAKGKKSNVKKLKTKVKITLDYDELYSTIIKGKDIIKEKNRVKDLTLKLFLHNQFPKDFPKITSKETSYKKNDFFHLLNKKNITENLSTDDIDGLGNFFPLFIKFYSNKFKGKERLLKISENKNKTQIIYLENIIKEYSRKLKEKRQIEHGWQEFLREYILFFNLNYANIIEKENVALEEKYPDFMLIDVYNYLDIYEIKTPSTNLLKKDSSRGNYYWDTELSKAISQVENYIDHINKNRLAFIDKVRRKMNLNIRVVKPRGFIIAGTKKQLQGETMEDNFRLLNKSMNNIEVILYDEFLNNLKNLLKRLKK